MNKKKLALIISLAIFGSAFLLYPFLNHIFPDNGAIKRKVWFIKSSTTELPYIIILDEIETGADTPIEWIQHGLESLEVDEKEQSWMFTTQDYFEGDTVKLYGNIITEGVDFEWGETFTSNSEDNEAPYIMAKTKGPQQLCTVLIPLNESMELPSLEKISSKKMQNCFKITHENTTDLFWSISKAEDKITEKADGWIPKAASFHLRTNQTQNLFSIGFENATSLSYDEVNYLKSSDPISGSLSFTGSGIDGTILSYSSTDVEIRIPDPGSLQVDNEEHDYDYSSGLLKFSLKKGSFIVGNQFENVNELTHDKFKKPSAVEVIEKVEDLSHPYLLFEEENIEEILLNLHSKDTLKPIYKTLNETTNKIEDKLIQDGEVHFEEIEWRDIRYCITGWIMEYLEGNKDSLKKIKNVLLALNDYHYTVHQTLHSALMVYGPLIAYDVISDDLEADEQEKIEEILKDFVKPLAEPADITPLNNHLSVNMGAVGLAGLVTKDPNLLQVALDETETFLLNETVDGVPIESFNYAHFGYGTFFPFLYALKRLDVIDYFKSESIIDRFLERTLDIMSPNGIMPHYEDVSDDWRQAVWLRAYSHLTENEVLRKNIAYFYEIQNQSSYHDLENKFLYYEPFVWRDLPAASPPEQNKLSWVSYKGGNGALRSGWSRDAVFISLNAKKHAQSHTHLDELSYEIHAYGAMLAMNLGYPGWKKEHHAVCVSTFGSNAIRLNDQDQLQEVCNGFIFHSFAKEVDIVIMDSGNLYRSPYSFSQNPIFYLIILLLQIISLAFALYFLYHLKFKKEERTEKEEESKEVEEFSILNEPLSLEEKEPYYKRKFFLFYLIYAGFVLRLYSFAHSIIRKMHEWAYTQDVILINSLLVAIWVIIYTIPLVIALILYIVFRKMENNMLSPLEIRDKEDYDKFNKRLLVSLPFISLAVILFVISIFLREYKIMDLLSKSFGTIRGFSHEFLAWSLFIFGMLSIFFGLSILFYLFIFKGFHKAEYRRYGLKIGLFYLFSLYLWVLLSIAVYLGINSFTIETWFA